MKLSVTILLLLYAASSTLALLERAPPDEDDDGDLDNLWEEEDALFSDKHEDDIMDIDLCAAKDDGFVPNGLEPPWEQPEKRNAYPPKEDGFYEVPLRKVWFYRCHYGFRLNMTEYRQAVKQMRWFCQDRFFSMKTSVYAAIYGETTAYACSRYGAAHPCNEYEWDYAQKALDHYCGEEVEGWIKFRGWPRLYGRTTLNKTMCDTVTRNLWRGWKYRVTPRPVWVGNYTMFDVWRDGDYLGQ